MPAEGKIKDVSTKPTSSSTSAASSYTCSNQDAKTAFRPLADLREWKWQADMGKSRILERDRAY